MSEVRTLEDMRANMIATRELMRVMDADTPIYRVLFDDLDTALRALEMVLAGIGGASDIDHWLAEVQTAFAQAQEDTNE